VSSSLNIPFVKASACGNDFLIIDGIHAPANLAEFSRGICDRHQGIGADGVEWLFPANGADIQARLLNSDGSEAEISGNGTRCVAAFLCSDQPREKVAIQTGAGVKLCTLASVCGNEYEFELAMGQPNVESEFHIRSQSEEVCGIPVSMGNPHFVIFVQEFPREWQKLAADIQNAGYFKQGINVEFVSIVDKHNIEVRFYERGVGETQSSGTGSCASAVASMTTNKGVSPVRVHAPGGAQTVRWDDQVYLRGPARLICSGEYFL
jgi:diaminopimelate epimerase